MPSDMTLAGVVGTTLGIVMKPQLGDAALDAALALAVALGMVGTIAYVGRMTWNSFFTHISEREMIKGNRRGVFIWNVLVPQFCQACVQVIPVTLFLMALSGDVLAGLNSLIKTVVGPLAVVGTLLPTLGLALNLRGIAKKTTMPFFFLGFILVQYLKMDVISIAILGLIIAYVMTFGKEETSVQA
jgi:mannose/fructose/N-acetylgalactosamine-specific phosphotransferase system component IIC